MPGESDSSQAEEERLIHQRNDAFFRGYFREAPVARPLIEWKLPPKLLEIYSSADLELAPNSYIDDDLRPYASDLLWKVKGNTGGAWFYTLWEHQKTPDAFMPLRCLRYLSAAWLDFLRSSDRKRGEKLRPAVAIVLYQGTQPWTQPTRFREMFDFAPGGEEDFGNLMPEFEIILVPLDQIPEEQLPQSKLCFLGLTLMQAAARGEEATLAWMDAKREVLSEVLKEGGIDVNVEMLFRYVAACLPLRKIPKLKAAVANLDTKSGTEMKTALDGLIDEGMKKGLKQGREEGRRLTINGFVASWSKKGLSVEQIADLANISEEEVRRALEADSE